MVLYRFTNLVLLLLLNIFLSSYGKIRDRVAECKVCGIQVPGQKIMNGTEVPIGKYPWVVSFRGKKEENFCSGTIISSKYILTAAHCVENLSVIQSRRCQTSKMPSICFLKEKDLLVGVQYAKDVKLMKVKRIIPHPSYNAKTVEKDIALIRLKKSIKCDHLPKPLCLPRRNLSKVGQSLIIAGYGVYRPDEDKTDKLMEGKVKETSLKECLLDESKKDELLCAMGGKSMQASCQGDSGSTLVKKLNYTFYGIGITSVGPSDCSSEEGDVYTNVYKYMKWIKKYVRNLPRPKK